MFQHDFICYLSCTSFTIEQLFKKKAISLRTANGVYVWVIQLLSVDQDKMCLENVQCDLGLGTLKMEKEG